MPDKKINKLEKLLNKHNEEKPVVQQKVDLNKLMNKINNKFQLEGIQKVKFGSEVDTIQAISTGLADIDYATGIGGWPRGRVCMIWGGEASWKSTTCLRTIAEAQKQGLVCAYIDCEHTFDKLWAKKHGVDVEKLLITEPDTLEQTVDIITQLVDGGVQLIVWDSLVAVAPHKEMYSDEKGQEIESIKKNALGVFAKTMSQWLRTAPFRIREKNCTLIVINQLRDNISGYGDPNTVPGGRAIKFASSMNIGMKKIGGKDGEEKDKLGNTTSELYEFVIKKNKVGVQGRTGKFKTYGARVDNHLATAEIGIRTGLIERPTNSAYVFNNTRVIGKDNFIEELRKNDELFKQLEIAVKNKMKEDYVTPVDLGSNDDLEEYNEAQLEEMILTTTKDNDE